MRKRYVRLRKSETMSPNRTAYQFADEGVYFVYPVHLNPNVRQPVMDILSGLSNVCLIEPLDYLSSVHLLK